MLVVVFNADNHRGHNLGLDIRTEKRPALAVGEED